MHCPYYFMFMFMFIYFPNHSLPELHELNLQFNVSLELYGWLKPGHTAQSTYERRNTPSRSSCLCLVNVDRM
jgi:hypothetical protein